MIISVWLSKGGVGKTTVAQSLAMNTALPFKTRLLVDLDPQSWQGGQTFEGVSPVTEGWHGATDAYLAMATQDGLPDLGDVLYELKDGTLLLRSDRQLGSLPELWPRRGAIREPHEALAALLDALGAKDEDVLVVLDLPPGSAFSPIPRMGLRASQGVLVPMNPAPLALSGLMATIADLKQVKNGGLGVAPLNPTLALLGVVLNRVSGRKDGIARSMLEELPGIVAGLGTFGGKPIEVLKSIIRERVDFPKSQLFCKSIFEVGGKDAVEDALALGEEVSKLLLKAEVLRRNGYGLENGSGEAATSGL